jgi:hypothetical protein
MQIFPFDARSYQMRDIFTAEFLRLRKKHPDRFDSWADYRCQVMSPKELKFTVMDRAGRWDDPRLVPGETFTLEGDQDLIRSEISNQVWHLSVREYESRMEEIQKAAIKQIHDAMMARYL